MLHSVFNVQFAALALPPPLASDVQRPALTAGAEVGLYGYAGFLSSCPSPRPAPHPPVSCPNMAPPAVDAGPSSTLPRPRPAPAGPQPERCRSLGDLSRSPPVGRRAAVRAASSSADVSPLRRVLTRRMNTCAHHRPRPACTVVVQKPVCSPAPLWCSASK